MSGSNIQCPNCTHEFALSDSIAGPLLAELKKTHAAELAQIKTQRAQDQAALEAERERLQLDRQKLDTAVQEKVRTALEKQVAAERTRIQAEETEKLAARFETQAQEQAQKLAVLQEQLNARTEKLAQAQNAQAELLKKSQELEDAKREMGLSVQKQVAEQLGQARAAARQEVEQRTNIALTEKNEQLAGLQKQIEELKRRSEQGSQQAQGEALEVVLEESLAQAFPRDHIEPVPKGVNGADVVHRIAMDNGSSAGIILWESKRTKAWAAAWLAKLREDQRAIGADISVLISEALPQGVTTFGLVDGVWVAAPKYAISLAHVIRAGIVNAALAKKVSEGQESKMELVYNYLTGTGFRARVEAIVERFAQLSDDLDKEKKFMTRKWAKQEKQLDAVRTATLGLHGDLQGIAGANVVPELESMDALMLDLD